MSTQTTSGLPKAILLMGPTASGKTDLAIELAQKYPVELISVDSAQVFKEMNLGTSKPDRETLLRYPHHLIDLITPEEAYSAARFRREALEIMESVTQRGKIPLLVGGTMLYFKALLDGLAELPEASPEIRAEIDEIAAQKGWPAVHAKLAEVDPETALRLKATDSQRIQRAMEVYLLTGENLSTWFAKAQQTPLSYHFIKLGLLPKERTWLHERIARRFDIMLEAGLEEEIISLRNKYTLSLNIPSMRCVGYRQIFEVLEGLAPRAELRDRGIFATRQLSKRQATWISNTLKPEIFDCQSPSLIKDVSTRVKEHLF